eukprot:scaffold72382_cov75-Phaeocystis_antarctica.AAC.2
MCRRARGEAGRKELHLTPDCCGACVLRAKLAAYTTTLGLGSQTTSLGVGTPTLGLYQPRAIRTVAPPRRKNTEIRPQHGQEQRDLISRSNELTDFYPSKINMNDLIIR